MLKSYVAIDDDDNNNNLFNVSICRSFEVKAVQESINKYRYSLLVKEKRKLRGHLENGTEPTVVVVELGRQFGPLGSGIVSDIRKDENRVTP